MNATISSIVAATDFSETADLALERAARLAGQHGARLELVHASPLPIPMPVWGDMAGGTWIENSELVDAAQSRMERIRADLAGRYPGIEIALHCEASPPERLVLARGDENDADLIVIGATGEGALARRLFGSTAQSIVRHARRPLLVVRRPLAADYARLLIASDFSDDAMRAARLSRRLAPQAQVALFTALEQPRIRLDALGLDDATRRANLDRARKTVYERLQQLAVDLGSAEALIHVRDGRASHELDDVLRATDADLLAIGAHGKTRIEAGLLGSTSLHAVAEAPCDVLVVPHGA